MMLDGFHQSTIPRKRTENRGFSQGMVSPSQMMHGVLHLLSFTEVNSLYVHTFLRVCVFRQDKKSGEKPQ